MLPYFRRKPDWGGTEEVTINIFTQDRLGENRRSDNFDARQTGGQQKYENFDASQRGKTEKARMIFLTQASLGKNRRSVYELFNASQATPGVPMQPVTETGVVLYSADLNGGVEIDKPTRQTLAK